jgi:hypothetical protein
MYITWSLSDMISCIRIMIWIHSLNFNYKINVWIHHQLNFGMYYQLSNVLQHRWIQSWSKINNIHVKELSHVNLRFYICKGLFQCHNNNKTQLAMVNISLMSENIQILFSCSLQNICKQKRSASRHFFIKLSDVFGILFGLSAQVNMAFIFEINTNLNENHKEMYLKSVNHKIVMWNTNRPRRLYFTIISNLLFLYSPIFSLNCICCHLFSADNISVFTVKYFQKNTVRNG